MKISPKSHKFAKEGSEFCQKRNNPSKDFQWLVNFCQSGKILPNLVTLVIIVPYDTSFPKPNSFDPPWVAEKRITASAVESATFKLNYEI